MDKDPPEQFLRQYQKALTREAVMRCQLAELRRKETF
jgi:hypothetical protein